MKLLQKKKRYLVRVWLDCTKKNVGYMLKYDIVN